MSNELFESLQVGNITLRNRVVMAPMTRCRATGNIPGDLMTEYYRQRSEAGLIITEGTSPSPNGLGYPRIPGLFNGDQAAGWRKVTDAVHEAGSRIFIQLMHVGRIGHSANLPQGAKLLGPSPIAAPGEMYTDTLGPQPHPVPAEMTHEDIENTIEEYVQSSQLAIDAGFDGVELHSANGYLLDQFLNTASNQRSDDWGGTIQGRLKFPLAVARRVAEQIGPERVGIRISPYGVFNGMQPDPEHDDLYKKMVVALSEIGLSYVHVVDHGSMGAPPVKDEIKAAIRDGFKGAYILSGGYDRERATGDLDKKRGDLVAFGRPFVSNPRLVSKLQSGGPLAEPDAGAFYTPGEVGYTDYPVEE